MSRKLLKVEQAAELLSLGRSKVYELLYRGELFSVKIGRCRRIPMKALDDYLAKLADERVAA